MNSGNDFAGVHGANLIAGSERRDGEGRFRAYDPRSGVPAGPEFAEATLGEVRDAVAAAAAASAGLRGLPADQRAALLSAIADELEHVGSQIVAVAASESALGEQRLQGELARTTSQLRSFARMLRDGFASGAIIDRATSATPDLRRCLVGIGPVAVFGAANFPLAFGALGGDTVSALAAGCPVVVKGHPAHPSTSELGVRAVWRAAESIGAPPGICSLLQGAGHEIGGALVEAEAIRAVAFTGSPGGGMALARLGAARATPIPVFAEMGSVNPVFVLPAAAEVRGASVGRDLVASMTLGAGQFCTKPGVVFVPTGEHGDALLDAMKLAAADVAPAPLLSERIRDEFTDSVDRLGSTKGVSILHSAAADEGPWFAGPSIFVTDLDGFIGQPGLQDECFGPAIIAVRCADNRLEEAAQILPGSLTATVQMEPADYEQARALVARLTDVVGRIVFNGYPTGVAVTMSQHHGGPFPATTDARFTSVGMQAIFRFLRPVAYQGAPDELLPDLLQDGNPTGAQRIEDWGLA